MPSPDHDELLTEDEAAEAAGRSVATINRWVRMDLLPVAVPPQPKRFRKSDVMRLAAQPPKPGPRREAAQAAQAA